MSRLIVRALRTAHCKRGPARCDTCREMDVGRFCVLDIDPPDQGKMQRRVIEVKVDGETAWREFDVIRTFDTANEAMAYAAEHHIEDVKL